MIGSPQVVRIFSFMKGIKLYKRASYTDILFAKSQTNNCLYWFWAGETLDCVSGLGLWAGSLRKK